MSIAYIKYVTMIEKPLNKIETIADKVINWVGSTSSLIVHTILFALAFVLPFFGFEFSSVLLVVTTIVSLEAIYLAIFIQMSINRANKHIEEVGQDIDEIQEDIDEIQEDVDEIQEDVDEIQEDVGEINEEIDELNADDEQEQAQDKINKVALEKISLDLSQMIKHIEELKKNMK
jgi:uncharacterized protein YoxC